MLVAAEVSAYYAEYGSRIYDSYDTTGAGPYIQIDTSLSFWRFNSIIEPGPMNRCAVWGNGNPERLGFSVCVDIPEDKTYYMGFGADNSGILTIDGDTVLQNMSFEYWGIYKHTFSKGRHLVEFADVNFGGPAAIGFEIYDNTATQIAAANGYSGLKLIYSTHQEIGAQVEEGPPDSSYACPVGFIQDYCASAVPVCSQFVPISLHLNNPEAACSSSSVDITAPQITAGNPSSLTYTYWQDSLATKPLDHPEKVTTSGTYYIMGSFNGCYLIKPITVAVSSVSTTINKTICPGGNYQGHTKTGAYVDTLKAENGCDSLVTLNLTVSPAVNLGVDRNICAGDSVLLSPGTFSQYLWQDNSTGPSYVVKTPGIYWVTVTDENGCISSDTVVFKYGGCFGAKIPNAFTPNGDGVNDTWDIDGLQNYPQCAVLIYDRWGTQVFKSIGYARPWDGRDNTRALPVGTYYYIIDLKNNTKPISGFVTLIR